MSSESPPPLPAATSQPPAKRSPALTLAQLSLVAPILAIVLGFIRSKPEGERPIDVFAGAVVQGAILLGGVVAGGAALIMARRAPEPKRVRKYALWGLAVFAAVVALLIAASFLLRGGLARVEDHIAGTWVYTLADGPGQIDLELRPDRTFHFALGGGNAVADFSGRWRLVNAATGPAFFNLVLDVDQITDGNREKIGNRVNWSVDKIEDDTLHLGAKNGVQVFQRKK